MDNGGDAEAVWRIVTQSTDKWLTTVDVNTWGTFRRIGKIRVGVKSATDKVFIRSDWNDLPDGRPKLLRSLITRRFARYFKACVPSKANHIKEILYPHEVTENGRGAVDLSMCPKAGHQTGTAEPYFAHLLDRQHPSGARCRGAKRQRQCGET